MNDLYFNCFIGVFYCLLPKENLNPPACAEEKHARKHLKKMQYEKNDIHFPWNSEQGCGCVVSIAMWLKAYPLY
jgi:hypothetical protein